MKVSAVLEWPTLSSWKHLQLFLGFANFYRWFTQGDIKVIAPLASLTSTLKQSPGPMTLRQHCLISSLYWPAPVSLWWSLMVWILAWALSSQQDPTDQKLPVLSFFFFDPCYDVGNRELCTVVLAVQERRHWLEKSAHRFVVKTDHKNLTYLPIEIKENLSHYIKMPVNKTKDNVFCTKHTVLRYFQCIIILYVNNTI